MRLVFAEVNRDIFEAIKSGKKTVETRAATSRYRDCKTGDKVMLVCGKDTIEKEVKEVKYFASVDALVKVYTPEEVNPKMKTVGDLKKMYSSFTGYDEKIKEFGLVAFELK